MSWIDFFVSSAATLDGGLAKENRQLREELESLQDRVAELEAKEKLRGHDEDQRDYKSDKDERQAALTRIYIPAPGALERPKEADPSKMDAPSPGDSKPPPSAPKRNISLKEQPPLDLGRGASWLLTIADHKFGLTTGYTYLVGRGTDANIKVDPDSEHADSVSRQHARLTVLPDAVVIEDLNSSNGTRVLADQSREVDSWAEVKVRPGSSPPRIRPVVVRFGKLVACLGHIGGVEVVVQGRTNHRNSIHVSRGRKNRAW